MKLLSPSSRCLCCAFFFSTALACDGPAFVDRVDLGPPDTVPAADPGTLVHAEPMHFDDLPDGTEAYRVRYVSESLDGAPIAVTGMVVVPPGEPPSGGWTTVSWAHGTRGISDPCAPSSGFSIGTHDFFQLAAEIVEQGWLAVSSDYEGLGTYGVHPYLVGQSEGRGVLDIVRAAGQLDGVSQDGRVLVWGRSQGGHAALFAGQIAAAWAPELDVVGVVSAAPASDLPLVSAGASASTRHSRYTWQMILGMEAAYPELDARDIFSRAGWAEAQRLLAEGACSPGFGDRLVGSGIARYPHQRGDWAARLIENSPGSVPLPMPVLMLHGTADRIVPYFFAPQLHSEMCSSGTDVEFRTFEGESHDDSTALHMPELIAWSEARLAGEVTTPNCE